MTFVRQEIRLAEHLCTKASRWLQIFIGVHAAILSSLIFSTLNELWVSPDQLSEYRSGNWTARFAPFQLLLLAFVLGLLLLDVGLTATGWKRCRVLKEQLSLQTRTIAERLETPPLYLGMLALVSAGFFSDRLAILRLFDLILCAIAYAGTGLVRRSLNQPVVVDHLYSLAKRDRETALPA